MANQRLPGFYPNNIENINFESHFDMCKLKKSFGILILLLIRCVIVLYKYTFKKISYLILTKILHSDSDAENAALSLPQKQRDIFVIVRILGEKIYQRVVGKITTKVS